MYIGGAGVEWTRGTRSCPSGGEEGGRVFRMGQLSPHSAVDTRRPERTDFSRRSSYFARLAEREAGFSVGTSSESDVITFHRQLSDSRAVSGFACPARPAPTSIRWRRSAYLSRSSKYRTRAVRAPSPFADARPKRPNNNSVRAPALVSSNRTCAASLRNNRPTCRRQHR